jgi:hypothetical protein
LKEFAERIRGTAEPDGRSAMAGGAADVTGAGNDCARVPVNLGAAVAATIDEFVTIPPRRRSWLLRTSAGIAYVIVQMAPTPNQYWRFSGLLQDREPDAGKATSSGLCDTPGPGDRLRLNRLNGSGEWRRPWKHSARRPPLGKCET